MDIPLLFLKSLVLGFSIAMVLGPIGILCIQQTLAHGFFAGISVGLGAALADGIFAAIAGLGLSFIISLLLKQQFWIQLIGGAFLCYLGIKTIRKKPLLISKKIPTTNHLKLMSTTFLLTLSNPMTIISFSALFAAINISNPGIPDSWYIVLLFLSFFMGSLSWWLVLSSILTILRTKFSSILVQRIHIITGIILLTLGIAALVRSIIKI